MRHVRFGSLADMCSAKRRVRFAPKADICSAKSDVRFVPNADIRVSDSPARHCFGARFADFCFIEIPIINGHCGRKAT